MPKGESKNKGGRLCRQPYSLRIKGHRRHTWYGLLGKHKVLIDYAKKSIKLTTPDEKELEFIAEPVVTANRIANRAKLNQLDASQGSEVPVVNEFPDA
jgi:hypothetical protein